jgi:hypothetical protein
MTNEEQAYAEMMGSLLEQNPAQVTETPNIWSNLAMAGQDLGGMMGQSAVLGNKGTNTSGISSIGGGNTTNSKLKLINGKLVATG